MSTGDTVAPTDGHIIARARIILTLAFIALQGYARLTAKCHVYIHN